MADEVVRRVIDRKAFGVAQVDDEVIARQQKLADTFRSLGLLPRPIAVLSPGSVDLAQFAR